MDTNMGEWFTNDPWEDNMPIKDLIEAIQNLEDDEDAEWHKALAEIDQVLAEFRPELFYANLCKTVLRK